MEMTAKGNRTKVEKLCTISDLFSFSMAGCQQPHCDGIGELAPTPRQLLRPSLPTSPEPLLLSRLNYPKRERERDDGKSNQSFFQRSRPRTLSFRRRLRRRCHRFEAASHLLSFHSILSAPCCMGVNSKQQRAHEVPFWSICGNVLIC